MRPKAQVSLLATSQEDYRTVQRATTPQHHQCRFRGLWRIFPCSFSQHRLHPGISSLEDIGQEQEVLEQRHLHLPPAAADKVQCHCPESLDTALADPGRQRRTGTATSTAIEVHPSPEEEASCLYLPIQHLSPTHPLILVLTLFFSHFPRAQLLSLHPQIHSRLLRSQDRCAGGARWSR